MIQRYIHIQRALHFAGILSTMFLLSTIVWAQRPAEPEKPDAERMGLVGGPILEVTTTRAQLSFDNGAWVEGESATVYYHRFRPDGWKLEYRQYGGDTIVMRYTYMPLQNGMEVHATQTNGTGDTVGSNMWRYDRNSRITDKMVAAYSQHTMNMGTVYEYDSEGRQITEVYVDSAQKQPVVGRRELRYNKATKEWLVETRDPSGTIVERSATVIEDGRLRYGNAPVKVYSEIVYQQNGEPKSTVSTGYYPNGTITFKEERSIVPAAYSTTIQGDEAITMLAGGSKALLLQYVQYDTTGKELYQVLPNPMTGQFSGSVYNYDVKGNPVTILATDFMQWPTERDLQKIEPMEVVAFQYKYDDEGNWIERLMMRERNNRPSGPQRMVERRSITYYKDVPMDLR